MVFKNFRASAWAAMVLAAAAANAQDSAQNAISVTIDGRPVNFSGTGPQMVNGRVLVPLRGVFERLGAFVQWNPTQHQVVATRGRNNVELQIGNPNAMVDGRQVSLDVPAQIVDGATMVPIRFVSESIGAQVKWREAEQMVVIMSDRGRAQEMYAPPPPVPNPPPMRHEMGWLPRDTVIPVILDSDLSSDRSRPGDRFTVTVRAGGPDLPGMLPRGSRISGAVVAVHPRRGGDPGALDLEFTRLTLPDGTVLPFAGEAIFDRYHPRNAELRSGTSFGVRLTRDLKLRPRD